MEKRSGRKHEIPCTIHRFARDLVEAVRRRERNGRITTTAETKGRHCREFCDRRAELELWGPPSALPGPTSRMLLPGRDMIVEHSRLVAQPHRAIGDQPFPDSLQATTYERHSAPLGSLGLALMTLEKPSPYWRQQAVTR
jgi:hypothetical protein